MLRHNSKQAHLGPRNMRQELDSPNKPFIFHNLPSPALITLTSFIRDPSSLACASKETRACLQAPSVLAGWFAARLQAGATLPEVAVSILSWNQLQNLSEGHIISVIGAFINLSLEAALCESYPCLPPLFRGAFDSLDAFFTASVRVAQCYGALNESAAAALMGTWHISASRSDFSLLLPTPSATAAVAAALLSASSAAAAACSHLGAEEAPAVLYELFSSTLEENQRWLLLPAAAAGANQALLNHMLQQQPQLLQPRPLPAAAVAAAGSADARLHPDAAERVNSPARGRAMGAAAATAATGRRGDARQSGRRGASLCTRQRQQKQQQQQQHQQQQIQEQDLSRVIWTSTICAAARRGHVDLVNHLLPSATAANVNPLTVAHAAAANNQWPVVSSLIHGLAQTNSALLSPLSLTHLATEAAAHGATQVVAGLMDIHAHLHIFAHPLHQRAVLFSACTSGQRATAEYLLGRQPALLTAGRVAAGGAAAAVAGGTGRLAALDGGEGVDGGSVPLQPDAGDLAGECDQVVGS